MEKRLTSTAESSSRLQMLNAKDRRTIKQVVESEDGSDEKTKLQEALDQLHRTRFDGGGTSAIDFDHAERLIKARTKKSAPANGKPPKAATERSAEVAADALVDPDRATT